MGPKPGGVLIPVSVPAPSHNSLDEEVTIPGQNGSYEHGGTSEPTETTALLRKTGVEGTEGNCSFSQTVFNSVNLIVGLGFLALPYCLKRAGWIFGTTSLLLCLVIMNHTAKLVCRCLQSRNLAYIPSSFPELADAAFGGSFAHRAISVLFVAELYLADIAILIVAADNLAQLFPDLAAYKSKLLVGLIMYASTFLDLRYLSYTSLFGMLGSLTLVLVVVFDGLTKPERPGSIRDPMPTKLWSSPYEAILVTGILVSCLSGHAVYPSIYVAMNGRKRASSMLNLSFSIISFIYISVAVAGYLMFGEDVLNEITRNLLPLDHNVALNTAITYVMVVIPLTKFALLMEPVSATVAAGFWSCMPRIKRDNDDEQGNYERGLVQPVAQPWWVQRASKTMLWIIALGVSILFPKLEAVLAIMGSLLSSSVSIVFPAACFIKMYSGEEDTSKWELAVAWAVLAFGLSVAVAGTVVSVMETVS